MKKQTQIIRTFAIILFGVAFLLSPTSKAEETAVDILSFKPSPFFNDFYTNYHGDTRGEKYLWNVGFYLHYQHNPLVLRDSDTGHIERHVLEHQLTGDFLGGFSILKWLDVGLAFPVVFYQDGEGALEGSAPSTFAIGDLRLHVKARMYKTKNGFFSLAFVPYFTFPTAKTTDDFTGSASLTAVPLLAASFDLKPLNLPDLRFGINAGYRFVKKVEIEDFIFDDEILLRVAASYQFYQDMFMAIAELNATTTATEAFQSLEHTPMEVIAGLRYFYKPFLHFNLGFSAGITPGYATPDVRVFAGAVITIPVKEAPVKEPEPAPPAVVDSDGDGLLDPDDDCPHAPEDMDQFEDEDGCPDDDNDSDGILDTQDACPNQPETVNQYEDEDGCPDSKAVIVEEKIVVMEKIYFAHGKSEILERSLPFLDETAELIKMHPEMMLIRIEGHTDSRGSHSYNMELSAARAKSVRNYLVKKGVEPERLTTKGFGWTRPIISPEKTEEEYEKNRRVEFIIVND